MEFDTRWRHPFFAVVSGPSQSGKSTFVKRLIENRAQLINPKPAGVVWCYSQQQPLYSSLRYDPEITFMHGIPEDLSQLRNRLLIFDDLMTELKNNKDLVMLTTRGCHHLNISCIHIVQNLFCGDRTSRINSQYITLMKNPSDQLQISNLAKQVFPKNTKYFHEAFEDACSSPHGYLLLDMHQHTPDNLRLRTNIFPGEATIVYTPINKSLWKCTNQS